MYIRTRHFVSLETFAYTHTYTYVHTYTGCYKTYVPREEGVVNGTPYKTRMRGGGRGALYQHVRKRIVRQFDRGGVG